MRTSEVCQRANTANVARKYDALAYRLFDSFTRLAIAPLMPALATFANNELTSSPLHERYVARPRSMARDLPASATCNASSSFVGMSNVRTKSTPVPRGITASSAAVLPRLRGR